MFLTNTYSCGKTDHFPCTYHDNTSYFQKQGDRLRGLVIDITERKESRGNCEKKWAEVSRLTNSLPETVLEADLTENYVPQSTSFWYNGLSREELEKGLNMPSFVVPEERERAIENIKKSMAGEAMGLMIYALRKNGTTFPAIVRINPIISENKVTGLRGWS